jgi:hypothetical protein
VSGKDFDDVTGRVGSDVRLGFKCFHPIRSIVASLIDSGGGIQSRT